MLPRWNCPECSWLELEMVTAFSFLNHHLCPPSLRHSLKLIPLEATPSRRITKLHLLRLYRLDGTAWMVPPQDLISERHTSQFDAERLPSCTGCPEEITIRATWLDRLRLFHCFPHVVTVSSVENHRTLSSIASAPTALVHQLRTAQSSSNRL